MHINQLECFLTICKECSLSKAANSLHFSQQGLSTMIIKLESELGCKLFNRTVKGCFLTDEGVFFAEKASQILDLYYESLTYLNSPISKTKRILKIASSHGVMVKISDYLLSFFNEKAPECKIQVFEYSDTRCENALEKEEAKLAFISGPIDNTKFDSKLIFIEPIRAIVNRNHRLADCDTIEFSQLRDEPIFISSNEFKTNHKFFDRCLRLGFQPKIDFVPAEIGVVISAAKKNLGVSIANNYIANIFCTPDLKVIPFADKEFVWDIYLVWKKDRPISHFIKTIISIL